MVMVNEALKELDSRKGVSSQAIRGYITEKYPSVDLVRLKYMIHKTLKKGFEGGVLVTENTDPNVEKAPNSAKVGAKKTKDQEAEAEKKKATAKKQKEKPSEDAKASASKVAPAKKPKSKSAEGTPEDQPKAQKTTKGEGAAKKGAKAKAFQKPMKGDTAAPEAKTTGK
ncbi:protein B4-like [Salvelinus alpinus]|uniref:protein B4-like n=1 Tax=Salvelinus alpinus TaxID=8036 RepID=UPI0039FD3739